MTLFIFNVMRELDDEIDIVMNDNMGETLRKRRMRKMKSRTSFQL